MDPAEISRLLPSI